MAEGGAFKGPTHGGSGHPPPSRLAVAYLGREHGERDIELLRRVQCHVVRSGARFLLADPARALQSRLENSCPWLGTRSERFRILLGRLITLAYTLVHPGYGLAIVAMRAHDTVPLERILVERLLRIGGGSKLALVGRSRGALLGTRIADRVGACGVFCMGYPFRRPGAEPESHRVEHLALLRTPTLILQGVADPYGGPDLLRTLPIAPPIAIRFLPTDHEFRLEEDQWRGVLLSMDAFLRGSGTDPSAKELEAPAAERNSSETFGFPDRGSMHLSGMDQRTGTGSGLPFPSPSLPPMETSR